MKIIKRNGAEEIFDRKKILAAVEKANEATTEERELVQWQIDGIAQTVEETAKCMDRALSVEEIQELVETLLMKQGAYETAKRYIRYRYTRNLIRTANTTDNQILTLIECNNEEVKQENSNTFYKFRPHPMEKILLCNSGIRNSKFGKPVGVKFHRTFYMYINGESL